LADPPLVCDGPIGHADRMTVEIFHNPNCSTSRAALAAAEQAGVEINEIRYLRTPPSAERLVEIIGQLEDPPTDLVRRDASFTRLGVTESDVSDVNGIVAALVAHPELLQRPLLVGGGRAIIGRPKDRVPQFLLEIG